MMVAGITAALNSSGVLNVVGTDADDQLHFSKTSGYVSIDGVSDSWAAKKVTSIIVDLGDGNDFVSLDSFANGGQQKLKEKVKIRSSAGNEHVRLANLHDVYFSGESQNLGVTTTGAAKLNGVLLNVSSSVVVSLSSGVLTVTATDGNDNLLFQQSGGKISIVGVSGSWSAAKVNSIVVRLQDGIDYVSLDSLGNGGTQAMFENVTVYSGSGSQIVHLADGHQVNFSGAGQTLNVATDGTATLDGQVLDLYKPLPSDPMQSTEPAPSPMELATTPVVLPGDYDGSGTVDASDYLIWRKTLGQTGPGLAADGNSNNQVDPGDYDIWRAHLGETAAVPTGNWFDTNIQDAALRSLGSSLYSDGLINRGDMMSLFQSVQDGGIVDATEFTDLGSIVSTTTLFGTFDYVWKLSSYIVNGNAANAKYQGQTLGNLAAGSTATKLANLVNKWFMGLDRPTASGTYRNVAGTLFVNGASYTDVKQGAVPNCYFTASLAEVAWRNPNTVTNMFIVNGDGTYTVRFYNNSAAEYVTVDSYLPTTTATGYLIYASPNQIFNNSSNELWVALAEKAYVQLNEMGWSRAGMTGSGQNAYSATASGAVWMPLGTITGQATASSTYAGQSPSFNIFVAAFNAGSAIAFSSLSNPASSSIVANHAYAVVGYDSTSQTVTLFNPWGIESGLTTLTWSQIQANFICFDRTA